MKIFSYILGIIPCCALLFSPIFANRVTPYVLGLPFFLFWIMLWVVLSSVCMAVVYKLDPKNRSSADE